jgi:cytochrome P450
MHCQTRHNPFQQALAKQISWVCPEYTPPSLLKLINPARLPLMWNYNRIMRNYLLPILKQTVVSHQAGDGGADMMNPAGPGPGLGDFKTKTVVSLAARAYLAEKKGEGDQPPSSLTVPSSGRDRDDVQLDREFIDMAIAQFVIFIFAGHDTTAVTLCFAYHLLSQNPSCLAKLRAEHDAVFGSQDRDPSPSAAVESSICANPNLLNSLPYTTAVVKETLRLFPPAATVREGQPDFFLRDPRTGKRYPTAGLLVHQNSYATHHLESLFPRPFEFVPERFLASEGEPLYVRKNAFRPFELGPRACIGQELAVMEIKMILAMTVREFEIESCFPRPGEPGAREILGHTVYQVGHMTGHPKDGMPVRVRVRGTG